MDEIRRRLLVLALIMLLAGCAREAIPQPQPTFQPPQAVPEASHTPTAGHTPTVSHTPTATPSAQSVDAVADQETAAPTQQITASPTPTSTAPATRAEATTTPAPQTAEPETADPPATGSTADLVERGLALDVTGVASVYAWTIERAAPRADPPLPAHLLMTFDGPTSDEALTGDDALLTIFPVEPYLGLAKRAGGGQTMVEEQIARLWQLVETDHERSGAPQGWMPLLPPADAPVEDWSDFAALDFVRGRGVRYLRLVGADLAYTYLGVTEDGRYAVSLTWPLGAAGAPDLEALDAMIASLALGEAPVES